MEAARPASVADVPAIEAHAVAGIGSKVGERGGDIWSQRETRSLPAAEDLTAAIEDPHRHVVVGTIDDVVVGYGLVALEELRTGTLLAVVTDLFVDPEARGVGVGEAIMDELIAWATERGCVGIDALALPGDRATKNFFESFGLKARAIVVHRNLAP